MTNKRIDEYIACEICNKYPASSTHEIFHDGTSYARNLCILNKYQIKVCIKCHDIIHNTDSILDRKLKKKWQKKIMIEKGWLTPEKWIKTTRLRNYI